MAKISRITQIIFGSQAPGSGVGTIGKFGSLAAGNPLASTDLTVIQSLGAWAKGWLFATVGNNGPELEDMNAFCFVVTTQLAYVLQQGIPEWDAGTTYYIGSVVNSSGAIYKSLADGNLNHALTDTAWWTLSGLNTKNVSFADSPVTMDPAVDYYRVDCTGGVVVMNLPALATSLHKRFKVKKIDSSANQVTLTGNAAELIDFANTYPLELGGNSVDLLGVTANWDVV